MNVTYLATNDLADFTKPNLGIELLCAQDILGEVVEVGYLAGLLIRGKDIHSLG